MSEQKGAYKTALTAVTGTTAGGALALANPEGETLLITRVIIYTTTKSTGAATMDVGVAANGTTSSDTLFDAVDVGTAAGIFDNIDDQGSNGQSCVVWGASQYVTATASASLAGLVGSIYIEYIRA